MYRIHAAFLARQVPTSGRRRTVAKTDSRGWTPFRRPLRYRSQAIGKNAITDCKKYTAYGLVHRGRPLTSQTAFGGQLPYKGSLVRPVARFHHSLFEHDGRLLRATCRVSGCTQDSRGLFGPSGSRPAEGARRLPKRTAVAGGPPRYSAIAHSCMMVSFYEPRATNHEPLFFHELRFTRGDVVILSLLPQSGILSPRRPANCGAVRPIHRIVDNVAISLYNINTYSYSMRLAEKGDFIDEF